MSREPVESHCHGPSSSSFVFRTGLCSCDKVAENGCFRDRVRHPFHQSPIYVVHTSGRFNPFSGSGALAPSSQGSEPPLPTFRQVTFTYLYPSLDYGLRGLRRRYSDTPADGLIICLVPACNGLVLQDYVLHEPLG